MKKLIATDLDGTLLYPRSLKFIPGKNVKFLRNYIDDNGSVLIITSRGLDFAKNVIKKISRPMDVIAFNGSIITHNNEIIREKRLENSFVKELVADFYSVPKKKAPAIFLSTSEYGIIIDQTKTNFINGVGAWSWSHLHGIHSEKFKISKKTFNQSLESGIIYKVVIFNGVRKSQRARGKELAKHYQEKFPECEITFMNYVTEITPKHCNKASSLEIYSEKCGYKKDEVIVIGDSENDVPMFKAFPSYSFCMKHASEAVQKFAKYQVKYVHDLLDYPELLLKS